MCVSRGGREGGGITYQMPPQQSNTFPNLFQIIPPFPLHTLQLIQPNPIPILHFDKDIPRIHISRRVFSRGPSRGSSTSNSSILIEYFLLVLHEEGPRWRLGTESLEVQSMEAGCVGVVAPVLVSGVVSSIGTRVGRV